MRHFISIIFTIVVGFVLVNMNIDVESEDGVAISWVNKAIANDEEENDDDEEIEVIVITAPGGGGVWGGGGWVGGGGWGGGGGGLGGGGGGDAPIEPPEDDPEEESPEVCLARAEVRYEQCQAPIYMSHLDAMRNICPYFLDLEIGGDARVIFGSVTVRSYDSCVNTANSMQTALLNDCDVNRAFQRLNCLE